MIGLTLGNWIAVLFFLVCVLVVAILISTLFENMGTSIMFIILCVVVYLFVAIGGLRWYNTHTASGIRSYKDFQSELSNGLEREITIYAEDGREIFHYEGRVDIESNHTDNYIKFESEDGKRYMIYYGIQDTIMIVEK